MEIHLKLKTSLICVLKSTLAKSLKTKTKIKFKKDFLLLSF